jgi:hypothetical protein
MIHRTLVFLLIATVAVLSACSSSKTMVESDLGIDDAPDWVNEGTQILKDQDGRLFHGVGSAQRMGDDSLQISTADSRARAEIAKILSSYLDVALKDYSASASASGDSTINQQDVERTIQSVSQVNVTGARIIAHWRHPKRGTIYALAELDMKQVKSTLDQVGAMNSGLRDYLRHEGDNVFDNLAKGKR